MSWTNAVSDLRRKLADNSSDKLSWRKTVFGVVDGSNTKFKTYEWRRVTDFTTVASDQSLGVFVNQAFATVVSDDVVVGQFQLATPPTDGDTLEASYYNQWFIDAELESFLVSSTQIMAFGSDYLQVPEGLRPAALEYACGDAFKQLALRYRQMGEMYRVEDLPRAGLDKFITEYNEAAQKCYEEATKRRDEFYDSRQGQAKQPLYASILGTAVDPQPKR